MAVVYSAIEKDLDRPVAIKVVRDDGDPDGHIQRLENEARGLAALHHPHIVRIHETGQVAGQHYFVMEYIAGSSLAERVREKGALPADKAARTVCTVARAVEQAERSRLLRICLLENGYNIIAVLPTDTFLRERIAQLQPDLIVVDSERTARDSLEHVVMATRDERPPIALFHNAEDHDAL